MNAKDQTWNENVWVVTRPNKKARVNNRVSELGGGTNIQSKQARVLLFKS